MARKDGQIRFVTVRRSSVVTSRCDKENAVIREAQPFSSLWREILA